MRYSGCSAISSRRRDLALSRLEKGRRRQGLVPDFMLELPCAKVGKKLVLAELKTLSCGPTRYPLHARPDLRAVDRRARELPAEYRRKARETDRVYGRVPEGIKGPVENKLDEFGDLLCLVVGAFGEVSEDLHYLINTLAEAAVRKSELRRGQMSREGELSTLTGEYRRMISLASVKAQAECLLTRLNQVGEGQGAADRRQRQVVWGEERLRRQLLAQKIALVQGRRGLARKGHFMRD